MVMTRCLRTSQLLPVQGGQRGGKGVCVKFGGVLKKGTGGTPGSQKIYSHWLSLPLSLCDFPSVREPHIYTNWTQGQDQLSFWPTRMGTALGRSRWSSQGSVELLFVIMFASECGCWSRWSHIFSQLHVTAQPEMGVKQLFFCCCCKG